MKPSLLEPPRPAGEPSVRSAILIPVSVHCVFPGATARLSVLSRLDPEFLWGGR